MYDDPKRYENDDLYENEELDSEDEYEANDYAYIVDDEDEGNENALWDDEDSTDNTDENSADDLPREKRKKTAVFADSDTDSDDAELYEKTRRSLAKEQRIIDELEADAKENPIEDEDEADDGQPE